MRSWEKLSRSVVVLMVWRPTISKGVKTAGFPGEKQLAFFLLFRRQAQDARHHGRCCSSTGKLYMTVTCGCGCVCAVCGVCAVSVCGCGCVDVGGGVWACGRVGVGVGMFCHPIRCIVRTRQDRLAVS